MSGWSIFNNVQNYIMETALHFMSVAWIPLAEKIIIDLWHWQPTFWFTTMIRVNHIPQRFN